MGLDIECKALAQTMKTRKQAMRKSITKKCIDKKRSVGRPRKSNIKVELLSETSSESTSIRTSVITKGPDQNIHMLQTKKLMKSNSIISDIQV